MSQFLLDKIAKMQREPKSGAPFSGCGTTHLIWIKNGAVYATMLATSNEYKINHLKQSGAEIHQGMAQICTTYFGLILTHPFEQRSLALQ